MCVKGGREGLFIAVRLSLFILLSNLNVLICNVVK